MNRDLVEMVERTDHGDIVLQGPIEPEDFVFFPPDPLDKFYDFMEEMRRAIYRAMGLGL